MALLLLVFCISTTRAQWTQSGSNIYYTGGKVGIGTTIPAYLLHVETSLSARAIFGKQSASSGATYGGWFESASTSGMGVYGLATASTGYTYGVYGRSYSTSGKGIMGHAAATSGTTYGMYGLSNSTSGTGVYGWATNKGGQPYGGVFRVSAPDGHGLRAFNESTARATEARLATYHDNLIAGETNLSAGGAGFGEIGLHGRSTTSDGTGVSGESENWKGVGGWTRNGYGVAGHQMGQQGTGIGVWGHAESSTGVGVLAENTQNGPALEIRGQIVVSSAHTATDTPVFKHTTTTTNTSTYITDIDHPMCNGDPNAMLIVTHDWGTSGPYVTKPFGVWYDPNVGRWTIFIEDGSAMPLGAKFNVLVIKTGGSTRYNGSPPRTPSAVRYDDGQ